MTDDVVELRDPALIESFLRRDAALHIYELGDLDPVFWPYTRWFGWLDGAGRVEALVLLYQRDDLPVLLAFDREARGLVGELLERVAPRLPERVYAHLSPGLLDRLGGRWTSEPQGRHLKMELRRSCMLSDLEVRDVERLGLTDAEVAHALYDQSYPGHWFDARMLETGEYFRIRRSGTLVSVAGVHVLSRQHGVAALGNIATAPAWRGRGLARRAVARLCQSLLQRVSLIGLNVLADNEPAIACYERLGFVEIGHYDEFMLEPRGCATD